VLSDATLAYGEDAMRALLGIDELYRSESGDTVGLAVLDLDTQGTYVAEHFPDYEEAREYFTFLRQEAMRLPELDRRTYYDQLCRSTLAFIEWRERDLRFETRLSDFLHVPPEPARELEVAAIRFALDAELASLGYPGELPAKCAAWEARHRVAPDEVATTLAGLLHEAWDRTEARLVEVPASRTDGMRVSTVGGVPFNARCDYATRTIEINIDPTLTRPALKHLAAHEGLPGHYLQFKLRETLHAEGRAPADVLLSLVNSASSSVFEGIADAGMAMIDWIDADDRVQGLLTRHRAAIGTGAAWRLHALGWTEEAVVEWLRAEALTGGEGWVRNRMAFIAAPERAVLIWSYWHGEPAVLPAWKSVAPPERPAFLRYLYGRMHSTATVGMFRS